jgi:hypothetical protein
VKKLVPGIAVAALVGGVGFALLPRIANSDIYVPRGEARLYAVHGLSPDLSWPLSKKPEVLARTEAEICEFLLQEQQRPAKRNREVLVRNAITGAELKVEDSPP